MRPGLSALIRSSKKTSVTSSMLRLQTGLGISARSGSGDHYFNPRHPPDDVVEDVNALMSTADGEGIAAKLEEEKARDSIVDL